MRQRTAVRALGALTAIAVVTGLGSSAPSLAQEPPPEPPWLSEDDLDDLRDAQEDLVGDVTFSEPGGTFQGQVSVALSTEVAGAEIRYTTDGSLPTAGSPVYSGAPLVFNSTTELRAQPFAGGQAAGDVGTAVYLAESVNTQHDLPVLVLDSYGQGEPDREDMDAGAAFFDPDTSLDNAPVFATRAGFHLRGQSSASFDKTPYRLEFWDNEEDDADYPVLGMPGDGDWILRGPFPEKALIREKFVYDLGNEMDLYAPSLEFIELYVNPDGGSVTEDDYMGVYTIGERIENRSHRFDLKRLRDEPDDLVLPRVTGAYIWKFDWLVAEEPILPCSGSPNCWNFLELEDPDEDDLQPEQRDWITNHLQEFQAVLDSPDFANPESGYPAWIDVDSFVDHLIINELSREMDSYVRSTFFHKDRGEKITAGPLWDYDLTFGVGGFFENDQTAGWQYEQTRNPISNNWYPRLLEDPAFVEAVRGRWQELRGGVLSDTALTNRVQQLAAPLANGAQRNFARWPNLTTSQIAFFITPTQPTWQGQVDFMLDWMLQRAAWLDSPAGWDVDTPVTPPTSSPTPGPSSPPPTSSSPTPSSMPEPGGCTATYTVVNEWNTGFQGEVQVTAGSSPVSGWTVTWNYTNGQTITQSWGASVTGGPAVSAVNETWNGSLAPGASTSFGFLGTWNGSNEVPAVSCTAS